MNKSQRARSWCFTLNNYTQKDIDTLTHENFKLETNKFCFQEEKGENGTIHLQGVISYKDAKSFTNMKKLLPLAHWEQCRNLKRSLRYCSKDTTRNGKIYTHNYIPASELHQFTEENINKWLLEGMLEDMDKNPIDYNLEV